MPWGGGLLTWLSCGDSLDGGVLARLCLLGRDHGQTLDGGLGRLMAMRRLPMNYNM